MYTTFVTLKIPNIKYLSNHWLALTYSIFYFTFIFPANLNAQPPNLKFEHISLVEGLSQSIVNVIHQDQKGFMWFGTEDGLNKYDGYSFKVFKHNPFDSNSIRDNNIIAIHEDRSGDFWIGTFAGFG